MRSIRFSGRVLAEITGIAGLSPKPEDLREGDVIVWALEATIGKDEGVLQISVFDGQARHSLVIANPSACALLAYETADECETKLPRLVSVLKLMPVGYEFTFHENRYAATVPMGGANPMLKFTGRVFCHPSCKTELLPMPAQLRAGDIVFSAAIGSADGSGQDSGEFLLHVFDGKARRSLTITNAKWNRRYGEGQRTSLLVTLVSQLQGSLKTGALLLPAPQDSYSVAFFS